HSKTEHEFMSMIRTSVERAKLQRAALAGKAGQESGAARADQHAARRTTNASGQPLLSMNDIPRLPANWEALQSHRVITEQTRNPAEPAYRMVRTRVLRKLRSNNWRILGISSLSPDEGKTYTAVNLAISIAAEVG